MNRPECKARLLDAGLLLLRITAGGVGVLHGSQKLQGGVENFASKLPKGVPMPEISAWMAVGAETLGGALIILGLFTRLATIPFIFTMGVAFVMAHGMKLVGPGNGEHALVVGLMLITILLTGPGRISLDALLFGRKRASTAKPGA